MERLSDAEPAQASEQGEASADMGHVTRRAHLIFNPVAFGDTADGALARILDLLRHHGLVVAASSTTADDPGDGVAAAALARQPDLVIVAGGDGTIHAVARALLHTGTPLGIIPMGTVNNLADALHIPTDMEAACALIATGQPHAMDAGLIDGRPFFEAVSLGVAAPFFPLAEATRHQGLVGLWRAIVKGVPLLLRSRRTVVYVEADGKRRRRFKAWEITVANIPSTALHFAIAPDARLDDGQLDVVINAESHWWQFTRDALALLRGGRQHRQPYVRRMRARHIRLLTPPGAPSAPITIDGEAMGVTPATLSVAHHALNVIVASTTLADADGNDPAAHMARTPLAELLHSLTEPVRAPVKGARRVATVARRYWMLGALALLVVLGVGVWRWRRSKPRPSYRRLPGRRVADEE